MLATNHWNSQNKRSQEPGFVQGFGKTPHPPCWVCEDSKPMYLVKKRWSLLKKIEELYRALHLPIFSCLQGCSIFRDVLTSRGVDMVFSPAAYNTRPRAKCKAKMWMLGSHWAFRAPPKACKTSWQKRISYPKTSALRLVNLNRIQTRRWSRKHTCRLGQGLSNCAKNVMKDIDMSLKLKTYLGWSGGWHNLRLFRLVKRFDRQKVTYKY